MESDSDLYDTNIIRKYNTFKEQYQQSQREIPSVYKRELLNNSFPVTLTCGSFIYDIIINDRREIIFVNGIHTRYYDDVPNKLINTLKLIK